MKKLTYAIFGSIVFIFMIAAIAKRSNSEDDSLLSWDQCSLGDIDEIITVSGEIQPKTIINIGTSVSGEIRELLAKDGDHVTEGQPLVVLDQERMREDLARAESLLRQSLAETAKAEAHKIKAQDTHNKKSLLFKDGYISLEEYNESCLSIKSATLTHDSSMAIVAQNRANVNAMKTALSKCIIKAPVTGRVIAVAAQKGEMAIPGVSNLPGATLMVLSDSTEFVAESFVTENEVVRLSIGQPAQIIAESLPGTTILGSVQEIATMSKKSGMNANQYKVRILIQPIKNRHIPLRPGMAVRCSIRSGGAAQAVRVPVQAVLERPGSPEEAKKNGLLVPEKRPVVFVANKEQVCETPITTGATNNQYVEVLSGLSPDTVVITGPLKRLKDLRHGDRVVLKAKPDSLANSKIKR